MPVWFVASSDLLWSQRCEGLERAIASGRFDTTGIISLTASEAFVKRNQKRTLKENYEAQHGMIEMYKRHNVPIDKGSIMAAFGCNFEVTFRSSAS